MGQIHFANNDQACAGEILLDLNALTPPVKGTHYELWLKSFSNRVLRLGKLELVKGEVHFFSTQNESLLEQYAALVISIEPDQPEDELISPQVVLSAELAKSAFGSLQSFFAANDRQDKVCCLVRLSKFSLRSHIPGSCKMH